MHFFRVLWIVCVNLENQFLLWHQLFVLLFKKTELKENKHSISLEVPIYARERELKEKKRNNTQKIPYWTREEKK